MNKVLWAIMILIIGSIIAIIVSEQNQLAADSIKRETLLNEYEYVMADVWAENECLKDQLGIFNAPNGCN